MPKLIAALMRHGDYHQPEGVPGAHLPHALTERGRAQARAAAHEILDYCSTDELTFHDVVDSSRLLRAWETADSIASLVSEELGRGVRVAEYEELAERGLGAAANLTVDEIRESVRVDPRYADLPEVWRSAPYFRLPFLGAESLMEAGRRTARHIEKTMLRLARTTNESILKLFVGHAGSMRFAAVQLGLLEVERARKVTVDYCGCMFIAFERENRWRHVGGTWSTKEGDAVSTESG